MSQSINEINNQIEQCRFCRLHETRIHAVCGEGIAPSKFMFIAQAPGRTEDSEGKILIGPSGKVFNQLISSAGITREEIYITNMVKCFLPKCRKPRKDEIDTCYHLYLKKEIELVKPEIIVTLGYHVSKFIFKTFKLKAPNRFGFKTTYGRLFVSQNRKIGPLRHPATVVHKSKSIENLINEYKILKTLQKECPFISRCSKFEEYKIGLLPLNFMLQYCTGDWTECSFHQKNLKD